MLYRLGAFLCLAAAAASLGGCDAFNRAIGKEKVVPDEFAVVSRAPLAIPPDFSLRPPRLGALRPQEETPTDTARQAVFRVGDDTKSNLPPAAGGRSPGEGELLKEAGAADAPSNIRQLVESDANSGQVSDSLVDKLAFWRQDQKLGPTDAVINPVAESERLKSQSTPADQGTSAALASAPVIERTNESSTTKSGSSWFGWLTNIF